METNNNLIKSIGYKIGHFWGLFVWYLLLRNRTKKSCIHFVEKKIDTIEILPYIEKNKKYTSSEIVEEIFRAVKRFRKCPIGYYCASKSLSDSGIPIYWALSSREKNVRFLINGFNELSDKGYLMKFDDFSIEDIVKYINTIAIKYSFNGKILPRSFIKNGKIFNPNLIIKK